MILVSSPFESEVIAKRLWDETARIGSQCSRRPKSLLIRYGVESVAIADLKHFIAGLFCKLINSLSAQNRHAVAGG